MHWSSLLLTLPSFLSCVYSQTSSSKRGLVYVPNEKHPHDDSIWVSATSDLTWYYNYDSKPSPAFDNSTKLQFVPMLWGSSTTFLDDVTSQIKSGANISYVLTFNEPDGGGSTGGSAIPADTAAETWQREVEPLKKLGVKLGAPAVTGAPSGFTWLQNFFTACNGNCSVDFIPVHWYGNFEGLASHVGQVRGTYKNMTMWITEYADNNVNLKESQNFYNQSSQFFDRIDYITHYSYFGSFRSSVSNVGPNAAMLTEKGDLTDLGSWYLGGTATGKIPHGAAGRSVVFTGSAVTILLTCICHPIVNDLPSPVFRRADFRLGEALDAIKIITTKSAISARTSDARSRPPRYRTPSPPRDAVEPLSPNPHLEPGLEAPAQQWSISNQSRITSQRIKHASDTNDHMRRRQSYPPQNRMNALASIAHSTTSGWAIRNGRYIPATPDGHRTEYNAHEAERPAKRARSEKVPLPEWSGMPSNAASRPATSYQSAADSRMSDNETRNADGGLLLYFRYGPGTEHMATPSHQRQHSTPNSFGQSRPYDGHSPYIDSHPDRQADTLLQWFSTNSSVPRPTGEYLETGYETVSGSSVPPLHDFRHQLIEASRTAQLHESPSHNEDVPSSDKLSWVKPSKSIDRFIGSDLGMQDRPAQQTSVTVHTGCGERSSDSLGLSEPQNASKSQLKPDGSLESPDHNREYRMYADNYWPSMLATTIEQSAAGLMVLSTQGLQGVGPTACSIDPSDDRKASHPNEVDVPSASEPAVCAACKFTRNAMSADIDHGSTSWISCDGCKSWFHFACAGFKNEREVRSVDKYRCRKCKAIYGPTTYVRKSTRAHTAIDYAGLNQGLVKTSDERPEHHYIKPIKEGTINIQPENFARMRPELVTAEHFEKGNGMKEPIVIPAEFNPRPRPAASRHSFPSPSNIPPNNSYIDGIDGPMSDDWFDRDPECQNVPDHGQDALDMVLPHNLTVRKVAELYGPDEKVEVIDVKSQNGEGKKWNMRRWADYYENTSNKVVRNVISLEVSQSTLGRLIRRPQIVRDLDLQDSVWPAELLAKGEFPRVQFYCLMSVADCFTDFHIDFGGSSVFYHILKGKKTFFFIPPKEKHLKKYEEWCMSPAQNWTFLGDQTKECYRVDLAEGDTMLIPAGWIHAVWTPEDSLVIGGNFLTRLNYSMQLRITQVEKATGVARKFRYPHFQKIQWYTAIRYLERDPVPGNVRSLLETGGVFHRQFPAYHDFDAWGENSMSGPENHHARYYSQPELEGLPDLTTYLLRTALIDAGETMEGITVEIRNAVKKSIPRGFGEPLEIVRAFAVWCAWKRGNEPIPNWALPGAIPEVRMQEPTAKLSAAAGRKPDGETALRGPRRQSSRHQVQQPLDFRKPSEPSSEALDGTTGSPTKDTGLAHYPEMKPMPGGSPTMIDVPMDQQHERPISTNLGKRKSLPGSGTGSHRKTACESCRKRRRACKHKAEEAKHPNSHDPALSLLTSGAGISQQVSLIPYLSINKSASEAPTMLSGQSIDKSGKAVNGQASQHENSFASTDEMKTRNDSQTITHDYLTDGAASISTKDIQQDMVQHMEAATGKQESPMATSIAGQQSTIQQTFRGRSKACMDCRKSKRRCLHDEFGREDPQKVQEAATPRSGATAAKRRKLHGEMQATPTHERPSETVPPSNLSTLLTLPAPTFLPSHAGGQQHATPAPMVAEGPPVSIVMVDQEVSSTANPQPRPPSQLDSGVGLIPPGPSPSTGEVENIDVMAPSIAHDEASEAQATPAETAASVKPDEVDHVSTATPPPNTFHHKIPPQPEVDTHAFEEQPAASSLASPPASSHEDLEQPQVMGVDSKPSYSSSSSSRHSSRRPTVQPQQQRFTPDSAPTRRDSSSSLAGANGIDTSPRPEEARTPTLPAAMETTTPSSSSPLLTESAQKRKKARLGSEVGADEESLKLIRKIQREELGLRRSRGGVA
ncbi:MAG: hypothetical protein Q9218_001050 [Villophora microphyllina]